MMAEALSHKERTRARILEEAAAAMRASGSEGISVAALMKRAGLTHGGFYAHFASRDDLVAHAIDRMFEDSRAMLARHLSEDDPAGGLVSLIDHYLSERARTLPEKTCCLPSLAGEAHRLPAAARERFAAGIQRFQARIAESIRALGRDEPEALAASIVAEMVGAMALARSIDGDSARLMLTASRQRLKERLGI
ncbi:TetR/AcrR family transcriptional regulator [Sphingomonas sp. MMS24-J13]|uniref:TetR/AcrR family transcriptional regulator n=1 Tax=Sphingomonas sp. MMS24-J13 TaxID=3238686 RepID=UPI00384E3A4E